MKVTLESIERGFKFLTVWGREYPAIREFAAELYSKLPEELQKINQKDLWFHSPPIFHPLGKGNRRFYKHFHILYPRVPTDEDVKNLKILLGNISLKEETFQQYRDETLSKETVEKLLKESREKLQKVSLRAN